MEIKTKYKVGDVVWTIADNKLVETKIISPRFDNYCTEDIPLEDRLTWELEYKEKFMMTTININRKEELLFSSKEELIKSL
jgi:hypothetical protein